MNLVSRLHSARSVARSMNVILWSARMSLAVRKASSTSSHAPRTSARTSAENSVSHDVTCTRFTFCCATNSSSVYVCPRSYANRPQSATSKHRRRRRMSAVRSVGLSRNSCAASTPDAAPAFLARRPRRHTVNDFQVRKRANTGTLRSALNRRNSRSNCPSAVNSESAPLKCVMLSLDSVK